MASQLKHCADTCQFYEYGAAQFAITLDRKDEVIFASRQAGQRRCIDKMHRSLFQLANVTRELDEVSGVRLPPQPDSQHFASVMRIVYMKSLIDQLPHRAHNG